MHFGCTATFWSRAGSFCGKQPTFFAHIRNVGFVAYCEEHGHYFQDDEEIYQDGDIEVLTEGEYVARLIHQG